ncbi:MAG TPA: WYL domain-containing protein, partial [Gemmatimonadales bacterium]
GEPARARRRLADAFPQGDRHRVAALRERIFVGPAASASVLDTYAETRPRPMRRLQGAFVEARVIVAQYQAPGHEPTLRRLEPHALAINLPAWYLVAVDHSRGGAACILRLDRISAVEVLDDGFVPRPQAVLRDARGDAALPVQAAAGG